VVEDAGDAEVEHLDVVRVVADAREHHVFGLEVAVDDARPVGLAQCRQHLFDDVDRAFEGHPFGRHHGRQGDAGHELHRQEQVAVREEAGQVEVNDVGVRDAAGDLRLALEPGDDLGLALEVRVQHLECHGAADAELSGAEHGAGGADAAQLLDHELRIDRPADVLGEIRFSTLGFAPHLGQAS
jgi:hypothetical protein